MNDDARDYQRLAVTLATTGRYASDQGTLVSLRPPLYPAIVSANYLAFGLGNDDAVRAVQAVAALFTVVLVYRLGVLMYSPKVGLWAAALACFYPSLLGYANLLLSETFFTFFLIAFTWLLCEGIHRQNASILMLSGAIMGLAALTRSIMLLFLPIVVVFVFVSWRGSLGRRMLAAVLPLALFVAVIAPWAIRNTGVQQTITIIDVMGGRNAMMGNYEYTPLERSWATISDVPQEQQWHRVVRRERASGMQLTQGQLDKLALRHAMEFVWKHPWLTLKRDVVKFFNFWQLEREFLAAAREGYFGDLSARTKVLLAAIICGGYAAVLFTAVFGICCKPPSDRRFHWFLIASILFPCAVHALIFAHSRYHLPVIPMLALYAAAAIVHHREIWQRRGTWGFRLASALCLVVALGWLRELLFVDLAAAQDVIGQRNARHLRIL